MCPAMSAVTPGGSRPRSWARWPSASGRTAATCVIRAGVGYVPTRTRRTYGWNDGRGTDTMITRACRRTRGEHMKFKKSIRDKIEAQIDDLADQAKDLVDRAPGLRDQVKDKLPDRDELKDRAD